MKTTLAKIAIAALGATAALATAIPAAHAATSLRQQPQPDRVEVCVYEGANICLDEFKFPPMPCLPSAKVCVPAPHED